MWGRFVLPWQFFLSGFDVVSDFSAWFSYVFGSLSRRFCQE